MKILRSRENESIVEAGWGETQETPFEVRIDTSVTISKRAVDVGTEVSSPVERGTVMQAASLIRELFLAAPLRTVHTQANADRDKVAMLLE